MQFQNAYVGSMPCMPARREMHTGRYNFLHRSWGPLEPFDDSIPEMLAESAGVHTHKCTDHYHYWEDGGATYHNRYSTYDLVRGQEGDLWKGQVAPHRPHPGRGQPPACPRSPPSPLRLTEHGAVGSRWTSRLPSITRSASTASRISSTVSS